MIKKKLTGAMIIQEQGVDILTYTYNEVDTETRQMLAMNKQDNAVIDEDEKSEIADAIRIVKEFCQGRLNN